MITRAGMALSVVGLPIVVLALTVVTLKMDVIVLIPFVLPVLFVGLVLFGYVRSMLRR